MSDKNFKVKSGLNIPITSAAILTTDSSGNISSTAILPITAGGTGQSSATNALNALLPVQNGSTINYAITSDGSNVSWSKLYNQLIQNNGISVNPRKILNIVGATFVDDSGSDTTTITLSGGSSNYSQVAKNGVAQTPRNTLNLIGALVNDDSVNNRTNVTIIGSPLDVLDGGSFDSVAPYDGGYYNTASFTYTFDGGTP